MGAIGLARGFVDVEGEVEGTTDDLVGGERSIFAQEYLATEVSLGQLRV